MTWEPAGEFISTIGELCPNFKIIESENEALDEVCQALFDDHEEGLFQHLEKIPTVYDSSKYASIVEGFCNTLTHVIVYDELFYCAYEEHNLSGKYELFNVLDECDFPKLQHLEIRHHTNYKSFELNAYFGMCPNLSLVTQVCGIP